MHNFRSKFIIFVAKSYFAKGLMTSQALLFTIAAIGISETAYLIRKRVGGKKPICLLGETCHVVLESKYNRLFGVHNDILGFLFYLALSLITAFLVVGVGPRVLLDIFAKLLILGGLAMSLALIYIQGRIIHAWCFWCVMSALTVGLMSLIVLTNQLLQKV
jgi:uncharacterized membrane protein